MALARFGDKALKILGSVAGLVEWVDYISVKQEAGGPALTYGPTGYLVSTSQSANPAGTAWVDFIPVYVVARSTPWHSGTDGYVPFDDVTV